MRNVIFANLITLQTATGVPGTERRAELDLWEVILEASTAVQIVLLVLLVMSVACWFIMGAKFLRFSSATRGSRRFLEIFWGGEQGSHWNAERLESVYAQVRRYDSSPLAAVFRSGYVELARILRSDAGPEATHRQAPRDVGGLENVERALRRTAVAEMTGLEAMVPFLATTGSTAPFIGLFGTVWGIMNTFIAIHGSDKNLDVVLPAIAEALIATAIGLAAAIPAVMAYNYFIRRIRVLESEMESFSSDYLNIVRRHFLRS